MEGGELYERILLLKRFNEADTAKVAYQLLYALNYMHLKGIVHRDMKPENVLLENKD